MLTAGEADCNNSSCYQQTRFYSLPIAVAWEAGYGGMGGWLQKAEEADCNKMLPSDDVGGWLWTAEMVADAPSCGDVGGWMQRRRRLA